jgi:hypothetical protein
VGLSTISAFLQQGFSARSNDRAVIAAKRNIRGSAAADAPASRQAGGTSTTGRAADAVTAVPLPERRSHEERQHLELGALGEGEQGGAFAPPYARAMRWLA